MNREKLFKKIVSILVGYRVKKIAIFGSYARGKAKPESDVDILVEFSERKGLLDLVRIEQESVLLWIGFKRGRILKGMGGLK